MRTDLPLIRGVLTLLPKGVLVPLGLTAVASATDTTIQKNIYQSDMTAMLISKNEMDHAKKIVKSLQESDSLLKDLSETIENESK